MMLAGMLLMRMKMMKDEGWRMEMMEMTCMLVLGLAWSDLEAPSFALNLFQPQNV